jgi:tetratricopeptide (TPR) repeat protein
MKFRWFLLSIFTAYINFSLHAETSAHDLLVHSQARFDQGNYAKALEALAKLNVRLDFDSSEDMITALKIRAISYSQTKQISLAEEAIRELLFIDPKYNFDLFDTPKIVVEIAEREAKIIADKNKQLALVKIPAPIHNITQNLDLNKKTGFLTIFLPFGLNHYYLKAPTKALTYFSLQAFGVAANIGAFWWKQSYLEKLGSPRLEHIADRSKFQVAQITQYIALSTLLAAFTVSIIDAMISYDEGSRG